MNGTVSKERRTSVNYGANDYNEDSCLFNFAKMYVSAALVQPNGLKVPYHISALDSGLTPFY